MKKSIKKIKKKVTEKKALEVYEHHKNRLEICANAAEHLANFMIEIQKLKHFGINDFIIEQIPISEARRVLITLMEKEIAGQNPNEL